ncbi:hypothetical protein TSUD_408170 [Trifolium subterraneum]|uniref:Uncharacterized protein n=1 Tax=Trifolium subterraneum TaxID=3900 RepID=A0A2Z6P0C7_TRISU|nr:hypothetical protein TSUD_408170 [Trifolium subterraneum]
MSFTFNSCVQPPTAKIVPPEPPDGRRHSDNHAKGKGVKEMISFRDKVIGNQISIEREKMDLLATNKAKVELVQGNRLMPMLHVENSVIAELSLPWKDALVVKLLGKSLGYNTMKAKLEYVWKLTGDKNKVINGGPWIIYDHILAVSQWTPTFNAVTARIDKTMVWIRIPSLNLVYYDESLLWALASMVGTPIKVDLHTLKVARGRFARMCVEIDLTKPVVGRVGINGDWYHVQYEGLHIIWKKNNSGENNGDKTDTGIGEKIMENQNVNQGVSNDENPSKSAQAVGELTPDLLHGEWIKVERRNKNKKVPMQNNLSMKAMKVMVPHLAVETKIGDEKAHVERPIAKENSVQHDFDPKQLEHHEMHPSMYKTRHNTHNNTAGTFIHGVEPNDTVSEKDIEPWLLTVIYASPRENERHDTWQLLRQLATSINKPWLMMGDFNEIAYPDEKKGGAPANVKKYQIFNNWINDCNLLEVTTAGTRFTWRGPKWNGRDKVFKKLDRVLCNVDWRIKYHDGIAKVLPRVQSDHHPIIVLLEGHATSSRNRPFRFEAAWNSHVDFKYFLNSNWEKDTNIVQSLHNLPIQLKKWNKDTFGDIFKRKKKILDRLDGIQNSSNYGHSIFLENLEKELQDQLAVTLYQEECLWFQKSRSQWISDGDRNTKYYHSKTIVRMRRNKIISLRKEDRTWVDEPESLKDLVRNFYINLFKEDREVCDSIVSWTTYPNNMEKHQKNLNDIIQFDECKKALFDMGPLKSPGEDGYPALFFQQNWDTVSDSLFHYINQVWLNPSLISSINNTLLVLIPKVDRPEFVSQFRPITLCNAVYKIITKSLKAITWSEAKQSSEAQKGSECLQEFRSSKMFRCLQEFRSYMLVMSYSEDEDVQKLKYEGISEVIYSRPIRLQVIKVKEKLHCKEDVALLNGYSKTTAVHFTTGISPTSQCLSQLI